MQKNSTIVIPAISKNIAIPAVYTKPLLGVPLISRAINTAQQLVPLEKILVVTDNDAVRRLCVRRNVPCVYNPTYTLATLDIIAALFPILEEVAQHSEHILIFRATAPLLTEVDIEDAYLRFLQEQSDYLVTVKSTHYRLWRENGATLTPLSSCRGEDEKACVEIKALIILKAELIKSSNGNRECLGALHIATPESAGQDEKRSKVTPYFLHDRSLEINSFQDWWIAERLLQSAHILVVMEAQDQTNEEHARALVDLLQQISGDIRVTFLYTEDSTDAVRVLCAKFFHTKLQDHADLNIDIRRLRPDIMLAVLQPDTHAGLRNLKQIPVVHLPPASSLWSDAALARTYAELQQAVTNRQQAIYSALGRQ